MFSLEGVVAVAVDHERRFDAIRQRRVGGNFQHSVPEISIGH
jgi:hypothetical protein